MDRKERQGDLGIGIQAAMEGAQAGIWTSMPATVVSFDPQKKTCVVQPSLKARVQKPSGDFVWVTMPLLVDCPVNFPSGGGFTLTFPVAAGDECLVVFASRCIDAWWQSGGVQVQAELRMHDLSDGFVFVGISSVPSVPASISTTKVELRNADRTARISIAQATNDIEADTSGKITATAAGDIDAQSGGNVQLTASGDVIAQSGANAEITAATRATVTAPTIDLVGDVNLGTSSINGSLTVDGPAQFNDAVTMVGPVTMSGVVTINGIVFGTHKHTGVAPGGGTSGGPTP